MLHLQGFANLTTTKVNTQGDKAQEATAETLAHA
jgi:hypothetical protein